MAVGSDGVHFRDATDGPLLTAGHEGSWDDAWVCQCSVTRVGRWWYMLYVGMSRRDNNKDGQAFGLARALHPAGPWEKYPGNPIFSPTEDGHSWDSSFLQHPCPLRIQGRWHLYYTGHDGKRYSTGVAQGAVTAPQPSSLTE